MPKKQVSNNSAEEWYKKGLLLNEKGKYQDAIKCFDSAIKENHDEDYFHAKGFALFKLGEIEKAFESFKKGDNYFYDHQLMQDPAERLAYVKKMAETFEWWYKNREDLSDTSMEGRVRAEYLMEKKIIDDFCEVFKVQQNFLEEKNLDRLTELMYLAEENNLWLVLEKVSSRILELWPENSDALFKKGQALYMRKKYDDALRCYEMVLSIGERFVDLAWWGKAVVYLILRKFDDSLMCWDKALETHGPEGAIFYGKGLALLKLNRTIEALACFNKAIEMHPDHASAWGYKGKTLEQLGFKKEAQQCFEKANQLDSSGWEEKLL